VQVYRVLQEALNNVKRHAGAQEAWVRLKFEVDSINLEVEIAAKDFCRMRDIKVSAWLACVSAPNWWEELCRF